MPKSAKRSRWKTGVASAALLAVATGATAWLYERYIGFEREPLDPLFPADTYAFATVKHVRKAAIDILADEQLKAGFAVAQAIALTLYDAAGAEVEVESDAEIDPQSLERLASHFKGQIALALVPLLEDQHQPSPDLLLAAHFSGSPEDFQRALLASLSPPIGAAAPQLEIKRFPIGQFTAYSLFLDPTLQRELGEALPLQNEPITPSWSVVDGNLYLALSRPALSRWLEHLSAASLDAPSLATTPAFAELDNHIPERDLSVYISVPNALSVAYRWFDRWKAQNPGSLLNAASLPAFAQSIGLASAESLQVAFELSADKSLYTGIRYGERNGLWNALQPVEQLPAALSLGAPILVQNTAAFDIGEALYQTKNAIIAASPITGFGYIALRSQALAATRRDLDRVLREGFGPATSTYLTADIGIGYDRFGRITEVATPDALLVFELTDPDGVRAVIDWQVQRLNKGESIDVTNEQIHGQEVILLPPKGDASLTANTAALAFIDSRLFVGYGTLGLFHNGLQRIASNEAAPVDPMALAPRQIGHGQLHLDQLPRRLSALTPIFYRQMNPGSEMPLALRYYDWSQLEILHLHRNSAAYDDGEGHLYRLSHQDE